MAAKGARTNASLSELYAKNDALSQELQELEVIISELKSVRNNCSVYVRRKGGNLFFLSPNARQTAAEYKNLLKEKQKEKVDVEAMLQNGSKHT